MLPAWFRTPNSKGAATRELAAKLQGTVPNCVCQEARCPNRGTCFTQGQLTFLILGRICTRGCGFCAMTIGTPTPPDPQEIETILQTIATLQLKYVVITSPTRDDLADGGAAQYVLAIQGIKKQFPDLKIEVLIPDLQGDLVALEQIIQAQPDLINHNLETVPSLYPLVRRGANYERSLALLANVRQQSQIITKTGLMVGLGETPAELARVFQDIHKIGIEILTIGQYLQPTKDKLAIAKYYSPDEFDALKTQAQQIGIRQVIAGPLVRSSYLAEEAYRRYMIDGNEL